MFACAVLLAVLTAAVPPRAQSAGGDSLASVAPAATGGTAAPYDSSPAAAPAAPTAGSSIANPATSVIGWFQAGGGNDPSAHEHPFELKEAELALQAAVDPFSRADFILSASAEGLAIEEAFLTWLALPGGGQAKVGKFRADLGKFNRTHAGETPFADRPLSTLAFTGEEGLASAGVLVSALVPNPLGLYWDVSANVGAVPDSNDSPVFQPDSNSDVFTLGRTSVFIPVHESADLNLGVSYANALANPALRGDGNRAQLAAFDLLFRWKNPRRAIYRSLVAQAELMAEQGSRSGAERYAGWFGYTLYQFARQWKAGARYDWTETPGDHANTTGALALLQYQPSEFSTLSLQARRQWHPGDIAYDAVFLKWTFNIGPHGAHPY